MTGLNLTVCLVYQRLRSACLKLKPEKCSLLQKSVSFLGHTISDLGIGTDPKKMKTVSDRPKPETVKDVRASVGLTSYYQRFVHNFAKIAAPLNAIARKNQRFQWSDDAQVSFDTLKDAMITAPILAMPNDNDEYTLDTDASDLAIGVYFHKNRKE